MLSVGLDTNAKGLLGNTPLHLSTNSASVRLLLKYGANGNLKNSKGQYPWDVWNSRGTAIPAISFRRMAADIRRVNKKAGITNKSLSRCRVCEHFKAAHSGAKSGLPKSKPKLLSARLNVAGFDSELNLLEMAILGFFDNPYNFTNAFNHIIKTDSRGALWTDRAYALAIAALVTDKISAVRLGTKNKNNNLGICQATSYTLKQCKEKGLIRECGVPQEKMPSISPKRTREQAYEVSLARNMADSAPELSCNHHLCFTRPMWDVFGKTLYEMTVRAALEDEANRVNNRPPGPALARAQKILGRISSRLPRDGYPAIYRLSKHMGRFSRENNIEMPNNLITRLPVSQFVNATETAELSQDSERSAQLIYAVLGECCMQTPGSIIHPIENEHLISFLDNALPLIASSPSGLGGVKSILREAGDVGQWLEGWRRHVSETNDKAGEPGWLVEGMRKQQKVRNAAVLFVEKAKRAIETSGRSRQTSRATPILKNIKKNRGGAL